MPVLMIVPVEERPAIVPRVAEVVARSREEGLDGAVLAVIADEIVAQALRIVAWLS
jgi:hypothetical protein